MGIACGKSVCKAIAVENDGDVAGSATPTTTPSTPAAPVAAGADDQSKRTTPSRSRAASPWGKLFSPSPAAGTPRRKFKFLFRPPSPSRPIATLIRRLGLGASSARSSPGGMQIPTENGYVNFLPQEPLDKRFGYSRNFEYFFDLGRLLGRGHFGDTYKARGLRGSFKNKFVAVKIISKAKMTTSTMIEDVRREVKIMRALSGHPNIVKIYDAFEDEENVYIVMELCQGGELLERIVSNAGNLEEEEAKRIVVQMLKAVSYIHLQGVVHRDLKPENFMFASRASDSQLKLIDFGLSDFVRPDERLSDVVGSAFYVSPEVLKRSYNVEADVWSLGVIAYFLLSGRRAFWGRTESVVIRKIRDMEPNLVEGPWPEVSTLAKDFVRRILIKDPKNRLTAVQALYHVWLLSENPTFHLDISIYTSVMSYTRASPLRRAALRALVKALTLEERLYLWIQFRSLEPRTDFVTFENFKLALFNNMSEAMRQSRAFDILTPMESLANEQLDYEEFSAATVRPLQLETLEDWETIVRTAYGYFHKLWDRDISASEVSEEEKLGPVIPSIMRQWVRADGKLSFLGFTKLLRGSDYHSWWIDFRSLRSGFNLNAAPSTSSAPSTSTPSTSMANN